MKLLALQDCPQGQKAGDLFDATDDAGRVLVHIGCAREVSDEDVPTETSRRRRYSRRDLVATEDA